MQNAARADTEDPVDAEVDSTALPRRGPVRRASADEPLAHALAWLTRHHGRGRSASSLLAGLPTAERVDGALAVRALHEAGFDAGLIERRIGDLSALLLPAVLLLADGDACVLAARHADGQTYDVVMPGEVEQRCTATEADLAGAYTGQALVATPRIVTPAAKEEALLADPSEHWFWGTLRRFTPYYRSALLAALLSNVLMLVTGLATSVIYDKVIPHQAFVTLWWLALGAGLALAFDLLARQLRAHLIDMAGRKADLLVGTMLFRQSLSIRMEQRPASAGAQPPRRQVVDCCAAREAVSAMVCMWVCAKVAACLLAFCTPSKAFCAAFIADFTRAAALSLPAGAFCAALSIMESITLCRSAICASATLATSAPAALAIS